MLLLNSFYNNSLNVMYYLGTNDIALITSSLFFGYIGAIIILLIDISTRDPLTKYSPVEFDFKYFLKDNAARFVLNIILVFIFIRFLPEFTNKPINQFNGLLIGIGSDMLAGKIKKSRKYIFDEDKSKDTQPVNEENQEQKKDEEIVPT